MSKALRKVTGIANKNNCALIFINQIREKVGVLFGEYTFLAKTAEVKSLKKLEA